MGFKVLILGSGSALPTNHRNPTAQYIFCNNRHILIDCGEGTQIQLRKNKVRLQKIDTILISHLHGDHYFGLVGLISTMHLLGRDRDLTIYGPEPLEKIVRMQLEIEGYPLGFKIDFVPVNGDGAKEIYRDNAIIIRTFPLNHRIPTNGFIIEETPKKLKINKFLFELDKVPIPAAQLFKMSQNYISNSGKEYSYERYTQPPDKSFKYAYCSDTKYDESIIEHIAGASLLYHEATFANDMKDRARQTYHSTAEQAATIAKKAKVSKLLLGHLSARYGAVYTHLDEAKAVFENTYVVNDGDEIVLY